MNALALDVVWKTKYGGFVILTLFGVVVVQEEHPVAVLDGRPGAALDFVHDAQDLGNLGVERGLSAVEDVAVGVGGLVKVIDQLGVGPNLAVVAGDQLEEAQDRALVDSAEHEVRGGFEHRFHVPSEAGQHLLEVSGPRLLDLPDVEVDKSSS